MRSFSDLSLSCPGQPVRDRMTAHYSVPVPTDTQVTFQGLWQSSRPRGEPSTQQLLSAPQLEKEERIHSVDIGNDGSAFVEVLVGSSAGGATAGEQDYEVSRVGTPRISIINPHLSSRQLWLPERGCEPPSCLPESPGRAEGTERAWGVSLIIRGDGLLDCGQARNKRPSLVVKFNCSLGHGPGPGVPRCRDSGDLLETKYSPF